MENSDETARGQFRELRGGEDRKPLMLRIEERDSNREIRYRAFSANSPGSRHRFGGFRAQLPESIDGGLAVEAPVGFLKIERQCWSEASFKLVDVGGKRNSISDELLERSPEAFESGGGVNVVLGGAAEFASESLHGSLERALEFAAEVGDDVLGFLETLNRDVEEAGHGGGIGFLRVGAEDERRSGMGVEDATEPEVACVAEGVEGGEVEHPGVMNEAGEYGLMGRVSQKLVDRDHGGAHEGLGADSSNGTLGDVPPGARHGLGDRKGAAETRAVHGLNHRAGDVVEAPQRRNGFDERTRCFVVLVDTLFPIGDGAGRDGELFRGDFSIPSSEATDGEGHETLIGIVSRAVLSRDLEPALAEEVGGPFSDMSTETGGLNFGPQPSDLGVGVFRLSSGESSGLAEKFRGKEIGPLRDGLGFGVESPLSEKAKAKVLETALRHPARISRRAPGVVILAHTRCARTASLEPVPLSSCGCLGEREIVNAWYGGAPSLVAVDVLVHSVRGHMDPFTRSVADEGSEKLGGAAVDDGRLSCLSAGGSGLLWMVDFTTENVKAASLRSALFFKREKQGPDVFLREVVMRGRRPLSACGKATPHVHVHHTAPQRRPRATATVFGFAVARTLQLSHRGVRSSRSRGYRHHAAVPVRRRWSVDSHLLGRRTLHSDGSHRRLRLSDSLSVEPHGSGGPSERSFELLVLRSSGSARHVGSPCGWGEASRGSVGPCHPGGESGVAHRGTLREGGAVRSLREAVGRELRSGSSIGACGVASRSPGAGSPASGRSRGGALMSAEVSLQQAGVSTPAVSASRSASRPGAELAAVLSAADAVEVVHREDALVLDAEKLEVYALALELHAFAASKVPTLSRVLKDQLERASLSVVLNIAEGGGRRSRKDKARHYTYARGSATEVAACFDVLRVRKLAPVCECARGRSLAVRVVQMLTKLCTSLQPKSTEAPSA
jgi:four helix bundle protein